MTPLFVLVPVLVAHASRRAASTFVSMSGTTALDHLRPRRVEPRPPGAVTRVAATLYRAATTGSGFIKDAA
jgi:hypothetical protein